MTGPQPSHLVKFLDEEAALQALDQQELNWRVPNGDLEPFELDHNSGLNFSASDLLNSSISTATAMLFSSDNPRGDTPMANAIRRWRAEERFQSADEAHGVFKDLLSRVIDQRMVELDELMSHWRYFCRTLRICSFCAKPDSLSAWHHQANGHRGLAIRFEVGSNSSFGDPQQVVYRSNRPSITTLKDQIKGVLNNQRVEQPPAFTEQFLVKPQAYKNEHEWRCFRSRGSELEDGGQEALHFDRSEIAGVYLGAASSDSFRSKVGALLKDKYGVKRAFFGSFSHEEFAVQFDKASFA